MSQVAASLPVAPNHLDALLGRTTVNVDVLASLTPGEIKRLRNHVSDRFLIALQPGHLRRFMTFVPLTKYRLRIINRARILIRGGAHIDLENFEEAPRNGRCGKEHKTYPGSKFSNCMMIFDKVSVDLH